MKHASGLKCFDIYKLITVKAKDLLGGLSKSTHGTWYHSQGARLQCSVLPWALYVQEFVRRSGAAITNIDYHMLVNVMQTSVAGLPMIKAIKTEYMMLTVMGRTDDYVNVLVGTNHLSTRVLRSEYNRSTMVYNEKYYMLKR